jgi:hypothetical protein
MHQQLFEDPASHLHDFLVAPGRMLSGRGTILVFINDMIFRVMKGKLVPILFLLLYHYGSPLPTPFPPNTLKTVVSFWHLVFMLENSR